MRPHIVQMLKATLAAKAGLFAEKEFEQAMRELDSLGDDARHAAHETANFDEKFKLRGAV